MKGTAGVEAIIETLITAAATIIAAYITSRGQRGGNDRRDGNRE
ncbi:hypothetical protein [Streptomyces sp. NPDC005435]